MQFLLTVIIGAAVGYVFLKGKIPGGMMVGALVGAVVLNRVASDRFPNAIEEVLLQERQYGLLHWTGLVWPERASRPGEAHAVERAYRQAAELLDGTVTDVLPEDVIFQSEYVLGEIVAESDGFYFCK